MKASHLKMACMDGEEMNETDYVAGMTSRGLLTFQFSTEYIKSLSAGTHTLTFQGKESVITLRLSMDEDGVYKIAY